MLLALTLLVLLNSCGSIKIKNSEVCAVKSFLQDGMFCAETLTDKRRELTFEQMVDFLEPNVRTNKGAAFCTSAQHYIEQKTTLEQACALLEDRCTVEIKQAIQGLERAANNTVYKTVTKPVVRIKKKQRYEPNFGDK